jgi:hypothetical protein
MSEIAARAVKPLSSFDHLKTAFKDHTPINLRSMQFKCNVQGKFQNHQTLSTLKSMLQIYANEIFANIIQI